MRNVLFVVVALLPNVAFCQATPGGIYRAPGQIESWSYAPEPREKISVEIKAPVKEFDTQGKPQQIVRTIGRYSITGGQWPGLKKNLQKFCKERNMMVSKANFESRPITIYLIPTPVEKDPDPRDPNYLKGDTVKK